MLSEGVFDEYVTIYRSQGSDKLFRHAVGRGVITATYIAFPEIILLDRSEEFFALYRTTGDIELFEIGVILRRAAHKIYREFCKIYKKNDLLYPVNNRFLNIVKKWQ